MIHKRNFLVRSLLIFISAASLALFSSPSLGATIRVPADQPTIQAGIDAAVDGDTVLVSDGTYTGAGNKGIDFEGKAITVQSQNGPDSCIIDCEGSGWAFLFQNGESEQSVLSGFTITGGLSGGIKCTHLYTYSGQVIWIPSSPTISNCLIGNNRGEGIDCYDSNPAINGCTVSANTGVGIYCSSSSPKITNSTISDNGDTGIYCISSSSPDISNCTISSNSGKGIYCFISSAPAINGCTIKENESIGIQCTSSSPTITNSTIKSNESWGIFCSTASPTITNCTIENNEWKGIHCSNGSPIINRCIVSNNQGTFSGGLEFEDCLSPKLINCLIAGNTTSASSNGAGIQSSSSALAIINCTITGNTAGSYGGIEILSGSSSIINDKDCMRSEADLPHNLA